jgi:hypothetical protein
MSALFYYIITTPIAYMFRSQPNLLTVSQSIANQGITPIVQSPFRQLPIDYLVRCYDYAQKDP